MAASSCLVQTNFAEPFRGQIFTNTRVMQNFHVAVPRFGFSNDLEDLVVGDSDDKKDYLLGLMAASLGFFCFILVWILVIMSFKCLGYQRVGFLSGRRMKIPRPPTPKVSVSVSVPIPISPTTTTDDETKHTVSSHLSTVIQGSSTEQNNRSFTSFQTNGQMIRKESTPTSSISAVVPFVSASRVKKRIIETKLRSKYSKVMESTNENLEDDIQDSSDGSFDLMASRDTGENDDDAQEQPTPTTVPESSAEITTTSTTKEVDPTKDLVYQQQLQDWRIQVRRAQDRLRRMRITVLFAGTCIIVASTLLINKGAYSLQQSVASGADAISEATTIAGNAVQLIDNFVLRQTEAQASTDELLQEINGFCPEIRESLCVNITSEEPVCDFSGIPYGEEVASLINFFDGTIDLVFGKLDDVRSDLLQLQEVMDDLSNNSKQFNWAFYVASGFSIALCVLTILIMVGVLLAWRRQLAPTYICVRSYLVVPLFIFLVILGWIFSMIFVVASLATSDLCVDSPDDKILSMLQELKGDFDSVVYDFLVYYIKGCPRDVVPIEMDQRVAILAQVILPSLQELSSRLSEAGQNNVEISCGSSFTPLIVAVSILDTQLCVLTQTMADLRLFMSCANWYPLYEEISYNAICYNGVDGFAWIASSQIVIVFMTFIIFTLRVACYEIEDEEDEEKKQSGFLTRIYCCCCFSGSTKKVNDE